MEVNKIVAAVCATLLVFLGLNFFAELLYQPHGDEELAYALAVEESGDGEAEETPQIDLAAVFSEADAASGESVFRKCSACHQVEEGANGVGPHLYGVVGGQVASTEGFNYSGALPADEEWTPENLFAFLENPKGYAPGTSMGFAGLSDPADRADVIAYLNQNDGSPMDLVAAVSSGDGGGAADGSGAGSGDDEAGASGDEAAESGANEAEAAESDSAANEAAGEDDTGDEGAAESGASSGEETSEEAASSASEQSDSEQSSGEQSSGEQSGGDESAGQDDGEASGAQASSDDAGSGGSGGGGEMAAAFAAADPSTGEKAFRQCSVCHKLEEGQNAIGPSLYGVVGRDIASVSDYNYSDALPADKAWTPENLFGYLENPMEWAPGTKMTYPGLKDPQDRADVISYINEADGSPEALPGQ